MRGETIDIPIRLHRDLPDDAEVKHVSVKQESTGTWYASFDVEQEEPEKPDIEDIDPADTVGIDLGVLNFIYDSDGRSVDRLNLTDDREQLEREQRSLSRKEYESNNWEKQRQRVAEVHMDMKYDSWPARWWYRPYHLNRSNQASCSSSGMDSHPSSAKNSIWSRISVP